VPDLRCCKVNVPLYLILFPTSRKPRNVGKQTTIEWIRNDD
jgi:hypothetical protein